MPMASFTRRLAPQGFDPSGIAASPSATVPLAVLLGGFLGVALVAKPTVVVALVALVLALIGIGVAFVRPDLAFGGLVVLLALVPTYASPSIGPLLFIPTAAASWVLGGALMWRNMITEGVFFRPNYVDYAVGAFVLLMTVSVGFSEQVVFTDLVHIMFMWAGPYLAARLLLSKVESPVRLVAISFAAMTVVLAPVAVSEALGGSNPFFNFNFNSGEFGLWASQIDRFGEVRAVTSFGHPISFSMFLACSALLSIAMGISSSEAKARYIWYALAVVAVGTMALALSRTGWVMLAVGVVVLAVITIRGTIRTRLITLLAIVVGVVLVTSVVMPNELQVIPGLGGSGEANYKSSGLYREALLERALEPGVLNLWGNPTNQVTPNVQYGTATDNAYIILADEWGLIPTFALFSVVIAMLVAIGASYGLRGEPIAILPIVALTCLVAIFFVAFITQGQVMIWLAIGAAGAAAERITAQRKQRRLDQRRSSVRG
ncbi:MAG: hypothetical protein WBL45_11640 [Solirubrobacterales bacterium]